MSLAARACYITEGAFEWDMQCHASTHDLVSAVEYAYISHCPSNIIEHVHDALQPADALLDDPSRLLQTIVWMGSLRLCQIPSSVVDLPTALQQKVMCTRP